MKLVNIIVSSFFAIAGLAPLGIVFAHDGQVNITGTIQSNTCIVDSDSKNLIVDMGNVPARQFHQAGAMSAAQSFSIKLVKCGEAASGVNIVFNGIVDKDKRLLALDSGEQAASGMGIAILDINRNVISLNTGSVKFNLTPGASVINMDFYAAYIANGDAIKAGDANATATFVLNYS